MNDDKPNQQPRVTHETNKRNFFRYDVVTNYRWKLLKDEEYQKVCDYFDKTGRIYEYQENDRFGLISVLQAHAEQNFSQHPEITDLLNRTIAKIQDSQSTRDDIYAWDNTFWQSPGLVNLSAGGIAFNLEKSELSVNKGVVFKILLQDFSDEPLTLYARISGITKTEDEYRIMCRFDPAHHRQQDTIARYIVSLQQHELKQRAEDAYWQEILKRERERLVSKIRQEMIEAGLEGSDGVTCDLFQKRYYRMDVSLPIMWHFLTEEEHEKAIRIYEKFNIITQLPGSTENIAYDSREFDSSLYSLTRLSPMSRTLILELWEMLDGFVSQAQSQRKELFVSLRETLIATSQRLSGLPKISPIQVKLLLHCRNLLNITFDRYTSDKVRIKFLIKEEVRKAKINMQVLRQIDITQSGIIDNLFYKIQDMVNYIIVDSLPKILGHKVEDLNLSATGVLLRLPIQNLPSDNIALSIGIPFSPMYWITCHGNIVDSQIVTPPPPNQKAKPDTGQSFAVVRIKFSLIQDSDQEIITQYLHQKTLESRRNENCA